MKCYCDPLLILPLLLLIHLILILILPVITVQKLELKKSGSFENEAVRGCIIIALRDRSSSYLAPVSSTSSTTTTATTAAATAAVGAASSIITQDPNELPEGFVIFTPCVYPFNPLCERAYPFNHYPTL